MIRLPMRPLKRVSDSRGLTLVEVLIASALLAVALIGIMGAFPTAYVDVVASGGESKATAYAQQKIEELKNQPFIPGPLTANDTPEAGFTRNWTITQVAGTTAPNRLARINVTVTWNGSAGTARSETVTLETMRAE
ncbi:MAG: prepilin-type N-terminal cleavage/methylation domain-containing protein [Candidatus Methylomirabilales bacterium]